MSTSTRFARYFPWNGPSARRYPWNGDVTYQAIHSNLVRVSLGDEWGLFDRSANWLEGSMRSADPTYCRWIASELYGDNRY